MKILMNDLVLFSHCEILEIDSLHVYWISIMSVNGGWKIELFVRGYVSALDVGLSKIKVKFFCKSIHRFFYCIIFLTSPPKSAHEWVGGGLCFLKFDHS